MYNLKLFCCNSDAIIGKPLAVYKTITIFRRVEWNVLINPRCVGARGAVEKTQSNWKSYDVGNSQRRYFTLSEYNYILYLHQSVERNSIRGIWSSYPDRCNDRPLSSGNDRFVNDLAIIRLRPGIIEILYIEGTSGPWACPSSRQREKMSRTDPLCPIAHAACPARQRRMVQFIGSLTLEPAGYHGRAHLQRRL